MKKFLILSMILLTSTCFAQEVEKEGRAGRFELGLRSTASLFGTEGYPGLGVGGQFRLQFTERINSEWFADWITTDLGGQGLRKDAHIGWSVMFYPFLAKKAIQPYILAGHCFDYTKVNVTNSEGSESANRLSSATQIGLGTHYRVTDQFDFSLSAQYMLHLGNDVHTEEVVVNGETELHLADHHGDHGEADNPLGLEGHLLLTLSMNYRIADLW